MKPVVDRLKQSYAGRIDFYVHGELNSDAEGSRLADVHGVTAIPTMMIVASDGTEIERIVGAYPESDLSARFDAALE